MIKSSKDLEWNIHKSIKSNTRYFIFCACVTILLFSFLPTSGGANIMLPWLLVGLPFLLFDVAVMLRYQP